MSLLSINIVNWNTRDYLRECLASIEAFPGPCETEVIVVDNASFDGSAEMVRQEFPGVHLVANSENIGYAAGNNQALAASTGDWLLLLNPDVRLLPTTVHDALSAAAALPCFGALGIKQVGADGRVQSSLRSFPDPIGILWEITGLSKLFPKSRFFGSYRMSWFDYDTVAEVDQPMATFLLTTRNVIEQVGSLDEDFPIFFNDVDWCYRVKETGRKVYYTGAAEIIHYGGAGTRRAKKSVMVAESKKSLLRFYEKHYRDKLPTVVYNSVCMAVNASLGAQRLRDLVKR